MERLRRPVVLAAALTSLPLVTAAVVLAFRSWTPVLDMAMTELRVRDVGGSQTPLVGLPGRIGEFPEQGSHPGPWSFYLIAPFYRLAGSTPWGLELGSVVLNCAAATTAVALAGRRFGTRGALCVAATCALAVRGYGLNVLTHPWNPYFPVLLWLLALVAAWLVLDGDHRLAPLVIVTTVIAAQTHVPYLVSAIALDVLVLAVVVRRVAGDGDRSAWRPVWVSGAVGAVMWLPPLVEQARYRGDGNLAKLVRHFGTEQDEPVIGIRAGFRLLTQHFDVPTLAVDLVLRDDALVRRAGRFEDGFSAAGAVVLALWCAAAVVAIRRRHRPLVALHAVVATTTLAGLLSFSRIFGKVWFYLTLWMGATVLLASVGLLWTAWLIARDRRPTMHASIVDRLAVVVGAVVTVASLVSVGSHDVPEDAAAVRQLVPFTLDRIDRDASYVVYWQEAAVPGALGFAFLDRLDAAGVDVGVHPSWYVAATRHRVRYGGQFGAELHVVSGVFIERWRSNPAYRELATVDVRSDAERTRFEELRSLAIERLRDLGRDDLVGGVDENMFRTSLEPGLPDDVVSTLDEMLRIGVPVSVFLAPAGSTI